MLQSTMGLTSIKSWYNAEILMVAWGGVKTRDAEKRLNSNGITLCHKMPKCVSILTFCVCVLGLGNRDNLSPYMTMSSLYTHISDIVHTFAHSVRWLFTLLTVSFDAQMFLNFDDLSFEVQIIYLFSFVMCPSGVISNRSSLSPKSWSFAPGFSPKNFIVVLALRSLTRCELIFAYGVR